MLALETEKNQCPSRTARFPGSVAMRFVLLRSDCLQMPEQAFRALSLLKAVINLIFPFQLETRT